MLYVDWTTRMHVCKLKVPYFIRVVVYMCPIVWEVRCHVRVPVRAGRPTGRWLKVERSPYECRAHPFTFICIMSTLQTLSFVKYQSVASGGDTI